MLFTVRFLLIMVIRKIIYQIMMVMIICIKFGEGIKKVLYVTCGGDRGHVHGGQRARGACVWCKWLSHLWVMTTSFAPLFGCF